VETLPRSQFDLALAAQQHPENMARRCPDGVSDHEAVASVRVQMGAEELREMQAKCGRR
jgi:hypothetical protein